MNRPLDPDYERASKAQSLAATPANSAWVTANAGSGKTRVLTNRVARLLLEGAKPDAVLCITYTKAAAAEMKARLFEQLGGWSTMGDSELAEKLAELCEEPKSRFDAKRLRRARALFAQALETPGGIKIQTIHAFAERLLRQFPLEAGAPPGFNVVDDVVGARLRADSVSALHAAPELADALRHVAVRAFEADFHKLLSASLYGRAAIEKFLGAHGDLENAVTQLRALCGARDDRTPQEIVVDYLNGFSENRAEAAIAALGESDKAADSEARGALKRALAAQTGIEKYAALKSWFFTSAGELRKSPATKAVMNDPRAGPFLAEESMRIDETEQRLRAARLAEASCALLKLAQHAIQAYAQAKADRAALDFDDLVAFAVTLLKDNAAARWIAYKLDQRIDHVLVDEAQDTAPAQWDLVRALIEEFFAGIGGRDRVRTVFAVGDEKQSIYSFQGADPTRFLLERESIKNIALLGGGQFVGPELDLSFRSTPEVLQVVDHLFDDADVAAFAFGAGAHSRHTAFRKQHQGRVEWWPGAKADEGGDGEPWRAPLDRDKESSAAAKLAQAIATRIRDDLDRGVAVWDGAQERPMRASDVMILVRKRGGLFRQILKELKRKQVPVAGADQITLKDEAAVLDLLAAARAALLPEDDLALAETLRTPLFGLSEADLFELAHGRGKTTLRERLRESTAPQIMQAEAQFAECEARARSVPPYEFFAHLLERLDHEGQSGWGRMITRLGREARESIEEMLSRALAHGQGPAPSLQAFVVEIGEDDAPVKREFDSGGDEARVMTVHGAKGLEAPVVILPDTISTGGARDVPLYIDAESGFLWAAPEIKARAVDNAKDRRAERARAEDLRLLYVAATRAKDQLIVCGALPKARKTDGSWHAQFEEALRKAGGAEFETPFGKGLVLGANLKSLGAGEASAKRSLLPDWALLPAPAAPSRRMAPTQSGIGEAALSPLLGSKTGRFRRGVLIHRLLQSLPEAPPEQRRDLAREALAIEPDLTDKQRKEILSTTIKVLEHPDLSPVFTPGGLAEAAIVGWGPGLPPGVVISGRADRLIVTADEAVIVDFKTNRPAPSCIEDAPQSYIAQMAAYRAVLAARLPGRKIRCALVWTDGPSVMAIPDAMLDGALAAWTLAAE
ncbi:MAG: double-strand break repair helicase AddA [Caulobacterales bacterium]